jgi:hypothetical protein
VALLRAHGWSHEPHDAEPGSTALARGTVRVELAFLQRDDAGGEPYTPIGDGRRATWAAGAFGQDLRTLDGVRARVITLPALREEKTGPRDDPAAQAKDRQDVATLQRLGGPGAGEAPRQEAVSWCGSFHPGRGKWQV